MKFEDFVYIRIIYIYIYIYIYSAFSVTNIDQVSKRFNIISLRFPFINIDYRSGYI